MASRIQKLYRPLFKIWRVRRQRIFDERIKPKSSDVLIDVGGDPNFWTARPQPVKRIDCVNVNKIFWEPESHPSHHIRSLIGDGCALDNEDAEYQILFSNSVIEHVGSWENQCKFAAEARRVGDRLWIQTPAFECPIEPHYLAPFVHWVPTKLRCFVARWLTPWGWIENHPPEKVKEIVESTRLLTRAEFQSLFPDCEILTERMLLVFPKSYIAIRV